MCFNISIAKTASQIASFYGINPEGIPPLPEYYHVSGFSYPDIPVLCNHETQQTYFRPVNDSAEAVSGCRVELMRWGLIPSWIKSEKDAHKITGKTLNARSETLSRLPSFRDSYKTKRCVVICDGFFEPHHRNGDVYPFFIRKKDRGIISLAALYAVWKNPESMQDIRTFTIITAEANKLLSGINNTKKRMPVILPDGKEGISGWLDPGLAADDIEKYFRPRDIDELEAFPVSKIIYKKEGNNTLLSQHPARYSDLEEGHHPVLPF